MLGLHLQIYEKYKNNEDIVTKSYIQKIALTFGSGKNGFQNRGNFSFNLVYDTACYFLVQGTSLISSLFLLFCCTIN